MAVHRQRNFSNLQLLSALQCLYPLSFRCACQGKRLSAKMFLVILRPVCPKITQFRLCKLKRGFSSITVPNLVTVWYK